MNEIIFVIHALFIGAIALLALTQGKEALVSFITLCCVLANVFVLKQTKLFGLNATCADAFAVGAVLGLNLLQEFYGKSIARKSIRINFGALIMYALFCMIQLWYYPSKFDTAHVHYQALMSIMPRIIIASFVAFITSQILDYNLFSGLTRFLGKRFLVIRTFISTMVSQFVDTVLFTFLGLYGVISQPWDIIIISYSVKVGVIILAMPLIAFARSFYTPDKNV